MRLPRTVPDPITPAPANPPTIAPSAPSYALPPGWRPSDEADDEEAAVWLPITDLDFWDDNPRHNDETAPLVRDLIALYGFGTPMMAWPDPARGGRLRIIAGNTRKKGVHLLIARYYGLTADSPELGEWHKGALKIARTGRVPVRIRADLTAQQATDMALADNKAGELSGWDAGLLAGLMRGREASDLLRLGWSAAELSRLLAPTAPDAGIERASATLAERFTVPPFTILDARQGYWKDRKRAWIDLGLKSYLGRENITKNAHNTTDLVAYRKAKSGPPAQNQSGGIHIAARKKRDGTLTRGDAIGRPQDESEIQTTLSIFDPVLAELAYRWFCPPGGAVLDPFAGGSVRGLVAQRLGLRYYGIDLRREQVEANQYQQQQIGHRFRKDGGSAVWDDGEAGAYLATRKGPKAVDMVFSCPPYMDLEVYSEDPADLSLMDPDRFWAAYRDIIARACARLANHRFAVWVVGEVRDGNPESGAYRGFVPGTIKAFEAAGLSYYNEAVLVTSLNSVPLRAAKHFTTSRKLCRTHQTVLVFLKGKWREAVRACGDVAHCMPDDLTQYVDGGPDDAGR